MQVAKPICNQEYFISTAIRLEKVLFKNKKSRVTAPPSDFNGHRPSPFNKLREKIFNHFISFRRPVMASTNNNRYIYGNILSRP
jgi:hypothetical protein